MILFLTSLLDILFSLANSYLFAIAYWFSDRNINVMQVKFMYRFVYIKGLTDIEKGMR